MSAPLHRAPCIDAARGLAVVAMIVYHASWFLTDAGLLRVDFASTPWVVFQRAIAGSFFGLVGVGVGLAARSGGTTARFVARTVRIAGCALVVTVSSAVLDPGRLVTFGILHSITLCSLVAWALRRAPGLAGGLGLGILLLGSWHDARFDPPALSWTGLGTRHAPTFDFQPLVPWLGVVLLGLAAGHSLKLPARSLPADSPGEFAGSDFVSRLGAPLALLGRHSLFVYMAHVPVLMGLAEGLRRWAR